MTTAQAATVATVVVVAAVTGGSTWVSGLGCRHWNKIVVVAAVLHWGPWSNKQVLRPLKLPQRVVD